MLVGAILKDPPPYVTLSGTPVERVTSFKLLGVYVASDLKWGQHVDAITSKAASHLYFLKDYVSSCGILLMPVVYQVVGFGRSQAASRIVTGGV